MAVLLTHSILHLRPNDDYVHLFRVSELGYSTLGRSRILVQRFVERGFIRCLDRHSVARLSEFTTGCAARVTLSPRSVLEIA